MKITPLEVSTYFFSGNLITFFLTDILTAPTLQFSIVLLIEVIAGVVIYTRTFDVEEIYLVQLSESIFLFPE